MLEFDFVIAAGVVVGAYVAEKNSERIIKAWNKIRRGVSISITFGQTTEIPRAFYD